MTSRPIRSAWRGHRPPPLELCAGSAAPSGLAEARDGRRNEFFVGVQLLGPVEEDVLGLRAVRIGQAALDRTDGLTRLVIVKAHALRTKLGIDDVDVLALADRF